MKKIIMDTGIDRKLVKAKPGLHIHFYTSTSPKILTFHLGDTDLGRAFMIEDLCVKLFLSPEFEFTEKNAVRILPTSMHLFQLWDCNEEKFVAPNRVLHPSMHDEFDGEYVLRMRIKYPPSLEKLNFCEVWEDGAFYYYFYQCRHDFKNDVLHYNYHSHLKEDLSTGIALVDLVRLAFERDYDLKALKTNLKSQYKDFLPKHVVKKTSNPLIRFKFHKSFDSALEETYESFKQPNTNPLRLSIVSYLKQLLPSVPDYTAEQFPIINHPSHSDVVIVHPYREGNPGSLLVNDNKGNLMSIGEISDLMNIEHEEHSVLLHFLNSAPQRIEFREMGDTESFISLIDGYFRLMYNYHYCLSHQIYSPIVKMWNDLKCYGPIGKDYLKVIWKRHESRLSEGLFLLKQKSTSYYDFVIIIHKMGRNLPVNIQYNPDTRKYSCDDLHAIFQSHTKEPKFSGIKQLVRYYRGGDSRYFRLTTQISPLAKEEIPLMVCRERVLQHKNSHTETSNHSLVDEDNTLVIWREQIAIGNRMFESRFFDYIEGTYCKEHICIKQIRDGIANRDMLTLCFQNDVQKCLSWRHDCLVRTFGICLSPFFSITPRFPRGRFDNLLKQRKDNIQMSHCVQAIGQLAQALIYLESNGWTHGNLRCKCILVNSFDTRGRIDIKLNAGTMNSYLAKQPITDKHNLERLPWIALERWNNLRNESVESDIFSLGVTIWEILSYAERPLQNRTTMDSIKIFMESGKSYPVPVMIENLKPKSDLQLLDPHMTQQYNVFMSTLYHKLIDLNCQSDPASRMNLQDIIREISLLNLQVSPDQYDPVRFPYSASSDSLSSRNSVQTETTTLADGISSPPTPPNVNSSAFNRPLPNIPASKQAQYIINQSFLTGLETGAKPIGAGFYGEVYLCKLSNHAPEGSPPIACAVKRLINPDKETEHAEKAMREFERELEIMVQLEHKNIVQLYGECFYTYSDGRTSRLIVMEYVQNKSLCSFTLHKAKNLPQNEQLTLYRKFSLDIAEGMKFLHSLFDGKGIIHRDLAARNVLITNAPYRAKITDFGLARRLEKSDYYRCDPQSVMPFLWCAPESIANYIFTKSSDVWSYAVVLWEMYSPGAKPLIPKVEKVVRENGQQPKIVPESQLAVLQSSGPDTRLPKPRDVESGTYNLMMRCWATDPSKRPTFEDIVHELEMYSPAW